MSGLSGAPSRPGWPQSPALGKYGSPFCRTAVRCCFRHLGGTQPRSQAGPQLQTSLLTSACLWDHCLWPRFQLGVRCHPRAG